jgi:hypothetical protein
MHSLSQSEGTLLFLVGTLPFTVPSLVAKHRSTPLKSLQTLLAASRGLEFSVRPLTLVSPLSSVLSHLFEHRDVVHWVANWSSLGWSAVALNLGLGGCSFLIPEQLLSSSAAASSRLQYRHSPIISMDTNPSFPQFWILCVCHSDRPHPSSLKNTH